MDYLLIAYGTETPKRYAQHIKRLEKEAEAAAGLDIYTKIYGSQSSHNAACLLKPDFILDALEQTDYDCVLLVDADTKILKKPPLPKGEWDIALPITADAHKQRPAGGIKNVLHFWRNNGRAKHFLKAWKYLCDWSDLTEQADHGRLRATYEILRTQTSLKFFRSEMKGCLIANFDQKKEDTFSE